MITIDYLKNKKIAIFGTGLDSTKCAYYLHNQKLNIDCFLNNKRMIETFMGYPVYEPCDMEVLNGKYVIIAVGAISTYVELSEQLQKIGMEEFKDYLYYKWIGKNLVLLHGNCHMAVIHSYLESSKKFSAKYAIYPNPCIYNNKDGYIKKRVLENTDVWIHEDIRKDNEYGYFLSDEYIHSFFESITAYPKEIVVPHLFGLGRAFFPQSNINKRNEPINNGYDKNGMFPHLDMVIDKCVKENKTVEEIVNCCKSEGILNKDFILNNFQYYMQKIKKREEAWDIKIYDFIVENYQKEKLFYDEGHPTNVVMKKISMDILNELGIDEECIFTNIQMDVHENPVYPVVRDTLGFKWEEREIRKSTGGKKMCSQMDFEEYIKEYLQWNYKHKLPL